MEDFFDFASEELLVALGICCFGLRIPVSFWRLPLATSDSILIVS